MDALPRLLLSLTLVLAAAFEARSSSPEELAVLVNDQLDIWRRAVADVGIALE